MENGEFWSCEKDKKHIFGLPGVGYCRQWCWGVGFSLDFIEELKMAENDEKPCFTFFAFLPPHIGVSGSLVSGMRKSVKRSIDWYQKFLISWLAARYSTVFVLRRSKWLKMTKNHVLRFLHFYPLILAFQVLSCPANDKSWRDLSIGIKNSQFHAIWLGIEALLCFSIDFQ